MAGTVIAEFAGTRNEAKAYAKEHGINYAQNLGTEPNGLPYVSIPYKNFTDLRVALKKFDRLGWDNASVFVTNHTPVYVRKTKKVVH